MSPSDDLPYWSYEELRDVERDYLDVLERLEIKYRLNTNCWDADDTDYPPLVSWDPCV